MPKRHLKSHSLGLAENLTLLSIRPFQQAISQSLIPARFALHSTQNPSPRALASVSSGLVEHFLTHHTPSRHDIVNLRSQSKYERFLNYIWALDFASFNFSSINLVQAQVWQLPTFIKPFNEYWLSVPEGHSQHCREIIIHWAWWFFSRGLYSSQEGKIHIETCRNSSK